MADQNSNALQSADAQEQGGDEDPLIGKTLAGRFVVQKQLAAGGMGVVYRAEQTPLGRLVALKVMLPQADAAADDNFSKRFFMEAAAVAKLNHPNTVVIHDYGQSEEGTFFLAMEYLEGGTLEERMVDGPLTPQQAIHVALQICGSLRDAHEKGIVHRDLKPGNVMFAPRGGDTHFCKVLDFGLVKMVGDDHNPEHMGLTQSGMMMGSPRYMAPEQVKAAAIDNRTDIYSLGAVLYHMVSGAPPFRSDTIFEAMTAHVYTPPPALKETWVNCPACPQLEATILRCLAKEPEQRFQTMDELIGALRSCEQSAGGAVPGLGGSYLSQSGLNDGPWAEAVRAVQQSEEGAGTTGPASHDRQTVKGGMGAPSSGVQDLGPRTPVQRTMRIDAGSIPPPVAVASKPSGGVGRWAILGLIVVGGLAGIGAFLLPVDDAIAPETALASEAAELAAERAATEALAAEAQAAQELAAAELAAARELAAQAAASAELAAAPVSLHTVPPGATVRRDGTDLGDAPVSLAIPAGERWTVEVSRSGFVTRQVTLVSGQAQMTLHLVPEEEAAPSRSRPGRATPRTRPRPAAPTEATPAPAARPVVQQGAPDLNDPWAN